MTFLFRGQYSPPTYEAVRAWFGLFVIFASLALPMLMVARFLANRTNRGTYWALAIPATITCLDLLVLLAIPTIWLIHRIATMGNTGNRTTALVFATFAFLTILAFLTWLLRPSPRAHRSSL